MTFREDGWLTTGPLLLGGTGADIYLNVGDLANDAYVQVELLDKSGNEIPGYSGPDAALMRAPKLHVKVGWLSRSSVNLSSGLLQVRFTSPELGLGNVSHITTI